MDNNDARVIELSTRFVREHETSPFAPDVRMKLAELYYRRQDFSNAQTQFELFAQRNPVNVETSRVFRLGARLTF